MTPLSLIGFVTFNKSLNLSEVLYYGISSDGIGSEEGNRKEITKDASGCIGEGSVFECLVMSGERFGLCHVGNWEPLEGCTE